VPGPPANGRRSSSGSGWPGWCARVDHESAAELATTLKRLAPRWFVVRNTHASSPPILVQPRYAMTFMRGPMTRVEIRRARGVKDPDPSEPPPDQLSTACARAQPFVPPPAPTRR
jgi:hypothetical protein